MIKRRDKTSANLLALGGAIVTISAAFLTFLFSFIGLRTLGPGAQFLFGIAVLYVASGVLFIIGIVIFLTGCFEVVRRLKVIPEWNDELLKQAIRSAPKDSTIRILQTWFPDIESFCSFLEELLIDDEKQYRFEILLINRECKQLISARVMLRTETLAYALQQIDATIARLEQMKQRVDIAWETKYLGAKLDLKIRCYKFMPLGPIYQINQSHLFVGYYLNYESSVRGPMLVIRDPKSRIWRVFEKNFVKGWEGSQ